MGARPDSEQAVIILIAVFLTIVLAIVCRMVAGRRDRARIVRYIEKRGGVVGRIRWSPFGVGWCDNKHHRLYFIIFRDCDGCDHEAYCKTSAFGGVYFTEDVATEYRVVEIDGGRCQECGYNLTGNASGVCPECGEPTPSAMYGDRSD